MDTITKIGLGLVFVMIVWITAEAIEGPRQPSYDHNRDGTVDIVDVSIAIDTLNKTVERCQ
jgi:hypothetical protein